MKLEVRRGNFGIRLLVSRGFNFVQATVEDSLERMGIWCHVLPALELGEVEGPASSLADELVAKFLSLEIQE